ncbi:MAG: hypothetical protein HQM11_17365 [SAR324 cluster bacterium]|nr:hypothetical protein [SAR324 cluster bacterium]
MNPNEEPNDDLLSNDIYMDQDLLAEMIDDTFSAHDVEPFVQNSQNESRIPPEILTSEKKEKTLPVHKKKTPPVSPRAVAKPVEYKANSTLSEKLAVFLSNFFTGKTRDPITVQSCEKQELLYENFRLLEANTTYYILGYCGQQKQPFIWHIPSSLVLFLCSLNQDGQDVISWSVTDKPESAMFIRFGGIVKQWSEALCPLLEPGTGYLKKFVPTLKLSQKLITEKQHLMVLQWNISSQQETLILRCAIPVEESA